jgi:hypothetical protein
MWKKIILLLGFTLAIFPAGAQKELSLDTLFGEYGQLRGSILINLGRDVLGERTRIERYKSLIVPVTSVSTKRIEEAVRRDFQRYGQYGNGIVIKEIHENGSLRNASYALGKEPASPVTEYILYARSRDKITLVYLCGRFDAGKLNDELDKLKDLFIKVYNKKL